MTNYDAAKLIDLFLDDELPVELASEFKEAMFTDPELSAEVSSLRRTKEALAGAFSGEGMSGEERWRVYARILAESAALRAQPTFRVPPQLRLPLIRDQFEFPMN